MSRSFTKLATTTASTKRPPALSAGKRGAPATYLTGLQCTPVDPVAMEFRSRDTTAAPYVARQTFLQSGPDILKGDLLVVGTVSYAIRAVEPWSWPPDGDEYLRLELEEVTGAH